MPRRVRVESPPTEEHDDCFILPFNPRETTDLAQPPALPGHPAASCIIDDGFESRRRASAAAITKCIDRMQEVLTNLRANVVHDAHNFVLQHSALDGVLMPFNEIPAAVVFDHDPGMVHETMNELSHKLEDDDSNIVIQLYPGECNTIMNAIKILIAKAMKGANVEASSSSQNLSNLRSWIRSHNSDSEVRVARVVVLFHDVEVFDVGVLQDLLGTCSLYVEHIPFIFCFGTSARPDFLRVCLPHRTLTALRIAKFSMSHTASEICEIILRKIYFDPNFEPLVTLGPTAFDLLIDETSRFNSCANFLRSTLRLIHIHHFNEPLTAVCLDERLGEDSRSSAARLLNHDDSRHFRERLLACTLSPNDPSISNAELLDRIAAQRVTFASKAKQMRIAFSVLEALQTFLRGRHLQSQVVKMGFVALARACLDGVLASDIAHPLCDLVRQTTRDQLKELLQTLHKHFNDLATRNRHYVADIRTSFVDVKSSLSHETSPEELKHSAEAVATLLSAYFEECFAPLHELPLYNVWCTGHMTCSAELLNANPRASTLAALQVPEDVGMPQAKASTQRSDTSKLFQRYLNGGKLVNIHDWFQSFAVGLEHGVDPDAVVNDGGGEDNDEHTPKRRRTTSRSPQKTKQPSVVKPMKEPDPAEWEMETKARFLRAFHELEYVGVVRQTKRKAEHIQRTVFDAPRVMVHSDDDG